MKKRVSAEYGMIPVFLALMLTASFLLAKDSKPFVGTWNGALSIMGADMEIIVKLSLDKDGNLQGTIDVPMQGATDLPLGDFKVEGKKISFKIVHPDVQGDPTFSGELDETGKKISGTFSQMGYEGTFSIEKK